MSWSRPLRSLTLRLTLIYMALFCGSIGLMLGATWVGGVWRPLQAVESTIRKDSDALAAVYDKGGRDALIRALERRAAAARGRLPYHVLIAPNGAVVAANLTDWPKIRGEEWLRYEFGTYATGAEEEHETVVRDLPLKGGYRLLIGLDTEDLDEREDMVMEALSWGAGVTLLLGLIGGFVMTYAVSQRLESINRAARAVIGGDLSGRVELRGSGDDFDQLSQTLNEMLERIESLVAGISRVSDNIAHELRTPLARLHAELEDLATVVGDEEAVRVRSEAAIEEARRLQSMFEALLRLARLQSGVDQLGAPVALSQVVEDAVDLHRAGAEEKGVTLTAEIAPDLTLSGDRDLLFQMASNLLDNAVKFTPPSGQVRVFARRVEHGTELEIVDSGPGIPAEARDRVFERFYRASVAEGTTGFGLGLSLVAAAAKRHRASIELKDAGPGLRVVIGFSDSPSPIAGQRRAL